MRDRKNYYKTYYILNKDKRLSWQKRYSQRNPENHIRYYYKNRLRIRTKINRISRLRYKSDLAYKIRKKISYSLGFVIRKISIDKFDVINKFMNEELIGCSYKDLKIYLESKFKPGMNWGNRGHKTWHIDHIVPISSFNLCSIEDLKKCCNYKNLQPLYAKENLKKGNKLLTIEESNL